MQSIAINATSFNLFITLAFCLTRRRCGPTCCAERTDLSSTNPALMKVDSPNNDDFPLIAMDCINSDGFRLNNDGVLLKNGVEKWR